MSAWADGPAYATQCPIRPGQSFTYRFNITGQEGTLWWHAHVSWIRATVYGALIIQPKSGRSAYPFARPHQEIPILLGIYIYLHIYLRIHVGYVASLTHPVPSQFCLFRLPAEKLALVLYTSTYLPYLPLLPCLFGNLTVGC